MDHEWGSSTQVEFLRMEPSCSHDWFGACCYMTRNCIIVKCLCVVYFFLFHFSSLSSLVSSIVKEHVGTGIAKYLSFPSFHFNGHMIKVRNVFSVKCKKKNMHPMWTRSFPHGEDASWSRWRSHCCAYLFTLGSSGPYPASRHSPRSHCCSSRSSEWSSGPVSWEPLNPVRSPSQCGETVANRCPPIPELQSHHQI